MRILTRYIFKEIASHALLGVGMFTFVLFTRDVGKLLDLLVRSTTTPGMVAWLFVLLLPPILYVTLPMGVLVGTLIGLSRMGSDSEVTAVRASGLNITTFFKPVAILALIGSAMGLYCAVYLGPRSTRELVRIENAMRSLQVSAEVQPHIFEERFPNMVLYVNDVSSTNTEDWRGLFLADLQPPPPPGTQPENATTSVVGPKITVAEHAETLPDPLHNRLQLHLKGGSVHVITLPPPGPGPVSATSKSALYRYDMQTFQEMDMTVDLPAPEQTKARPFTEQSMSQLLRVPLKGDEGRAARIEYHRRLAFPMAALVLALVAIPLGVASRKGGKSVGIVLALVLVLVYYLFWMMGLSLARDGRVPVGLGTWLPNIVFAIVAIIALLRADHMRRGAGLGASLNAWVRDLERRFTKLDERSGTGTFGMGLRRIGAGFPQILDGYVLRGFLFYFTVFLSSFLLLVDMITLFDLLTDINRNHPAWSTVGSYTFFLSPQLIYITAPLAVLVAALVSFALLTKDSEIIAMKACGVSLYRIAVPVFLAAVLIAGGLFALDYLLLPQSNRKQDALRNQIKGRAAQTFTRPDKQWRVGQQSQQPRIYYYSYFDSASNVMAGMTIYELDGRTFQLRRRIGAERARWENSLNSWVLEDGWVSDFRNSDVPKWRTFTVETFPELEERPNYFKKEVLQSQQMNYRELQTYIADLEQSGFNVVPLQVQLHKKFAFPFYAPIMALIAIPFAFSVGRRGALAGIAASMVIAMVYWTGTELFAKMGTIGELQPALAAWIPAAMFGMSGLYLLLKVRT